MRTNRSVFLCGLVAACAGAGGGEIDASMTADSDALPAIDAASDDAPPVDATPPDGAPLPDAGPTAAYVGWAGLAETYLPTNGAGSLAGAHFTSGPVCGLAGCGPALGVAGVDGECTLYDGFASSVGWSAGTITVAGGAATVMLVPSGTAPGVTYAPLLEPPIDAFAAGATLTFSAGGGAEIPAFAGAVTAPEKLAGWVPPTAISRTAGWAATWAAGTGGAIWLEVQAFDPAMSAERILVCLTNDDGAYTVASSALALIPASLTMGFAFVIRANTTIVSAGDAIVYLELVDLAVSDLLTIGP